MAQIRQWTDRQVERVKRVIRRAENPPSPQLAQHYRARHIRNVDHHHNHENRMGVVLQDIGVGQSGFVRLSVGPHPITAGTQDVTAYNYSNRVLTTDSVVALKWIICDDTGGFWLAILCSGGGTFDLIPDCKIARQLGLCRFGVLIEGVANAPCSDAVPTGLEYAVLQHANTPDPPGNNPPSNPWNFSDADGASPDLGPVKYCCEDDGNGNIVSPQPEICCSCASWNKLWWLAEVRPVDSNPCTFAVATEGLTAPSADPIAKIRGPDVLKCGRIDDFPCDVFREDTGLILTITPIDALSNTHNQFSATLDMYSSGMQLFRWEWLVIDPRTQADGGDADSEGNITMAADFVWLPWLSGVSTANLHNWLGAASTYIPRTIGDSTSKLDDFRTAFNTWEAGGRSGSAPVLASYVPWIYDKHNCLWDMAKLPDIDIRKCTENAQ